MGKGANAWEMTGMIKKKKEKKNELKTSYFSKEDRLG